MLPGSTGWCHIPLEQKKQPKNQESICIWISACLNCLQREEQFSFLITPLVLTTLSFPQMWAAPIGGVWNPPPFAGTAVAQFCHQLGQGAMPAPGCLPQAQEPHPGILHQAPKVLGPLGMCGTGQGDHAEQASAGALGLGLQLCCTSLKTLPKTSPAV